LRQGWNLISIPVEGGIKARLFKVQCNILPNSIFYFDPETNGYKSLASEQDLLVPELGYTIHAYDDCDVNFGGDLVAFPEHKLAALTHNWIGVGGFDKSLNSILGNCSGLQFMGLVGGRYRDVDSVESKKGYYVMSNTDCTLYDKGCEDDCDSDRGPVCNHGNSYSCYDKDNDGCLDWVEEVCAYGCQNGLCNNPSTTTTAHSTSTTAHTTTSLASTTTSYTTTTIVTECNDTDNGIDYFKAGNCSGSNGDFSDYCLRGYIKEYYCSRNNCYPRYHVCAYGCNAGACNNPSTTTTAHSTSTTAHTTTSLASTTTVRPTTTTMHTTTVAPPTTTTRYTTTVRPTTSTRHTTTITPVTTVHPSTTVGPSTTSIFNGGCEETDNYIDYENAGTCIDQYGSYSDKCSGNYVKEYYCSSSRCRLTYHYCRTGCSNGACAASSNSVTGAVVGVDTGICKYLKGSFFAKFVCG